MIINDYNDYKEEDSNEEYNYYMYPFTISHNHTPTYNKEWKQLDRE